MKVPSDFKLHHFGVIVPNLQLAEGLLRTLFQLPIVQGPLEDPLQKVKLLFLQAAPNVFLELIEPIGQDSPAYGSLKQRIRFHHVCFEVPDLSGASNALQGGGALMITEPQPASAFEGRRIAFFYLKIGMVVELLEAGTQIPHTTIHA